MSSRESILLRLKQARRPFSDNVAETEVGPVTPVEGADRGQLLARFIREAEALSCQIERVIDEVSATRALIAALGGAQRILSWELEQIPCGGLENALLEAGVEMTAPDDARAEVGITGAQAALAATGSLVLVSGPGRPRTAALLPLKHVAVIRLSQILPHLEAWIGVQRALGHYQSAANVMIISGPSRTADIAMQPILGMHGPAVLHIIIIEDWEEPFG